jgi:hypothetical protein
MKTRNHETLWSLSCLRAFVAIPAVLICQGQATRSKFQSALERRRLTADAGCDLVFPARQHETDGSQAPGQFLGGIDSRDRVRMQPRRARRGRHEHHDGPY